MAVSNSTIAELFERMAELLELEEANPFRVRAYQNAARTIQGLSRSAEAMLEEGEDLTKLPGIGKDLAEKIAEIVETGHLAALDEVQERVPAGLTDLLDIPGLGPARVQALHEELGIESVEDLAAAATAGKIRDLEGFGAKTEEKILHQIQQERSLSRRVKLQTAESATALLLEYLRKIDGVKDVVAAGSFRRRKETVGDVDILVTCKKGTDVMKRFVKYDDVKDVVSQGTTRSTVILRSDLQVDLRVVQQVSYGAALHYFTGSKAHNIAIRKMGQAKGLKINEYGVFKGDKRVAGRTEQEVYKAVNLPYIEPELREDAGELEAAKKKKLPRLVMLDDIRGDLHMHTKETDGKDTLDDMAKAAKRLGYAYIAISDHTRNLRVTKGVDPKRLRKQGKAIDKLNERLKGFTVLKSAEVDILEDGKLDLPDDVLEELDLVIVAVHSKFNLPRRKQTKRIITALDNRHVNILAHPTGRLLGKREPYDVDMEEIVGAAKERGVHLEVNAQPDRMDLSDAHCRMAKEMGVKVAIGTDAHQTAQLEFMRFGVGQARRGWLESDDVINTRSLRDLKKLLKRK